MKRNLPVTDIERTIADDVRIISVTDTKGVITHANQAFIDISGFGQEELLGESHNIVRHPDMPPEAFADLWQVLKAGRPWMGVVKNRCKNGDHYWVDAYVTPVFERGQVTGYQSVRTRATPEQIRRADRLYARLRARKRIVTTGLGVRTKYFIGAWLLAVLALGGGIALGSASWGLRAIALLVMTGLAFIVADRLTAPLRRAAREARSIFDNAIARLIYTGTTDEVGQVRLALQALQARGRTVIGRIEESARDLTAHITGTIGELQRTGADIQHQQSETDMVATAMNEMAATVQEVARNAAAAAEATRRADQAARDGALVATEALGGIDALVSRVEGAAAAIQRLEAETGTIGQVLDVIRGIAEQTNLLALNAAIEAARAGEQGRGFAVVAEEVRTLASRTQASTQEIQQMIGRLQGGAEAAVQAMGQARGQAQAGAEHVERTAEALAEIAGAVSVINDMNTQIASAAEEQSAVAEEINRNVVNISRVTGQIAASAQQNLAGTEKVMRLAAEFDSLVHQGRL